MCIRKNVYNFLLFYSLNGVAAEEKICGFDDTTCSGDYKELQSSRLFVPGKGLWRKRVLVFWFWLGGRPMLTTGVSKYTSSNEGQIVSVLGK